MSWWALALIVLGSAAVGAAAALGIFLVMFGRAFGRWF